MTIVAVSSLIISDMLNFTLRQLTYFVAVVDHGSAVKAAQALNISQPSISAAIGKLEGQIGSRIFIRHQADGLILTDAGRRLLNKARSLLAHADEFAEEARNADDELRGRLDIGCFLTITPFFMPRIIMNFLAAHPKVEIRLYEHEQETLIQGLEHGRYPVALTYEEQLTSGVEAVVLKVLRPYVLLQEDHRLARRESISLKELEEEPFILYDVMPSRAYFLSLFTLSDLHPNIRFRSPSFETVRGLVGNGMGFSILVSRPHGDTTYDGRKLACIPLRDAPLASRLVTIRLADVRPSQLADAFWQYCLEYFADSP